MLSKDHSKPSADHAGAKLPAETLIMIANGLDSLSDLFALANTCRDWHDVFQGNVWEMGRSVITRCIQCRVEALTLAALQEDIPDHAAYGYSMTPELLRRMTRNAIRLEKAKAWFNMEVMKQIRPSETEWCIEVWGTRRRPPAMTKTEELRFERAYYIASSSMEPKGHGLLDKVVLRHLYYIYDITHLNYPIGKEVKGSQGELDNRLELRRRCYARMEKLWDEYLPERDLKTRNTLALGPHAFGCFCQHLTMFDHYQSQIRSELLPKQPWSVDVHVTQEDVDQFIWGNDKYDDTDT